MYKSTKASADLISLACSSNSFPVSFGSGKSDLLDSFELLELELDELDELEELELEDELELFELLELDFDDDSAFLSNSFPVSFGSGKGVSAPVESLVTSLTESSKFPLLSE